MGARCLLCIVSIAAEAPAACLCFPRARLNKPPLPPPARPRRRRYGHHMSLHVAIGLLFLGGGKFSLNVQSNEAVAALVVSFFPVYPQHTKDGRYHLQAFRHMCVCSVGTDGDDDTVTAQCSRSLASLLVLGLAARNQQR